MKVDSKITHLSLFSGIGGFDLAAEWMGWNNIAAIEKDNFCQKVLKKNFPNIKIYDDVRTFPAANYTGRVDILTGGFPCQPFSAAGKRKGTSDDRHLWPEMLRVISIIKPTWVIAENVRGILSIESGLVFEQVCLDLEAIGYEVQPVIIPACSLDAPHKRERVWFIAYNKSAGTREDESGIRSVSDGYIDRPQNVTNTGQQYGSQGDVEGMDTDTSERTTCTANTERQNKDVASSTIEGRERSSSEDQGRLGQLDRNSSYKEPNWNQNWIEVAAEFCGVDDGLPVELEQFKLSKSRHRAEQLKGYGNAIVPQIAYEIFKTIKF